MQFLWATDHDYLKIHNAFWVYRHVVMVKFMIYFPLQTQIDFYFLLNYVTCRRRIISRCFSFRNNRKWWGNDSRESNDFLWMGNFLLSVNRNRTLALESDSVFKGKLSQCLVIFMIYKGNILSRTGWMMPVKVNSCKRKY